jgi:DNA-binding transcriptional ArsR family regulator
VDLYKDATGFRLLEWNLGSTIGGVECVDMCRTLLAVPELAAFLAKEELVYADTYEAMVATLRSETGHPVETSPVMALVETPRGFPEAEAMMRDKAARLADRGLPSLVGQLSELTSVNGWLRLAAVTGLPLGAVGNHLKVLLDAGAVLRRRVGREVLYWRTSLGDALAASARG